MTSRPSSGPSSESWSLKLPPGDRERVERRLRIDARALQLCEPYRRLYAHIQRKCPGVDVTKELRRIHAGEESRHPYLQMIWHWLSMIHPLGYVGPLAPDDREELDLTDILTSKEHIRDFLEVFGVAPYNSYGPPPDVAEELEDGSWISHDPRDAMRVPVILDLAMPNKEIFLGIELLRQITGIRRGQVRPGGKKTWHEDEGRRDAFALIDLAEKRPDLSAGKLAAVMWPRRPTLAGPEDKRAAAEQARRFIRAARGEIDEAGERVCRVLALRRRSREARRNPTPPPRTP